MVDATALVVLLVRLNAVGTLTAVVDSDRANDSSAYDAYDEVVVRMEDATCAAYQNACYTLG